MVKLIIIDNGVDGDIDLSAKRMGVVTELANIIDTIANSCTGAKTGGSDINGIGTMIDGGDAIFKILSRGK